MAISYRPYEPQQEMLLSASLQDWLPAGHLAYFISDTVDALLAQGGDHVYTSVKDGTR